jgi:hypothetical protein
VGSFSNQAAVVRLAFAAFERWSCCLLRPSWRLSLVMRQTDCGKLFVVQNEGCMADCKHTELSPARQLTR